MTYLRHIPLRAASFNVMPFLSFFMRSSNVLWGTPKVTADFLYPIVPVWTELIAFNMLSSDHFAGLFFFGNSVPFGKLKKENMHKPSHCLLKKCVVNITKLINTGQKRVRGRTGP